MHTFQPAQGHILAKKLEVDTETKSGLLIQADSKVDLPKQAYVINAFEGSAYQRGDFVMYKSYASHDIKLDDQEYIVLPEEDILGKVIEVSKRNMKQAKEDLAQIKTATTVKV